MVGMRAVRFHDFGDASVLRVDEVAAPRDPRRDELLVRVEASSINGTDLGLRRGDLKVATLGRMPFVPGFDVAGEVLACGPTVTAFSVGDRVTALIGHGGGGQAERILLRQRRAALAPTSVPAEQAAALPLAGLTALQGLGKGGLAGRTGARVLVNGASGGIGSFAVQLATLAGAHVTAVASGPKLAFVAELGADELVDYRERAVTALPGRFDLVLDAPGLLPFAAVRPLLADGGTHVSTRPIGRDAPRALVPGPLRRGPAFAAVMTAARSQDLAHLAALVDAGLLRVPLDRTYPLDEVVDAHRHAEGGVRGKVVLDLTR